MSALSAIPGLSATQSLLPNRFGQLSSEDFVKLIFTELRAQDPLKPNDTGELLKQIDSIRSIQTNLQLGSQLGQIASQNQLSGAGDLLGRFIKGISTDLQQVSGTVTGIQETSNGALLELDNGMKVPITQVSSIANAPPSGGTGTSGSGGSGGSGG